MTHLTAIRCRLIWLFAVAQVLFGLMLSGDASAANRRFCFRLRTYDTRAQCPKPNEAGNLRGCTPSQYREFFGGVFELWDRDTGQSDEYGGDDLIGTYVLIPNASDGVHTCVTFAWEGTSAQVIDGELNPDLYIIVRPQVMASNAVGPRVQVLDDFNQPYFPFSWRDYAAENCANTSCNAPFTMDVTWTGNEAWETLGYDMLDTAQHMLEVYGSRMGTNWISLHYQNADCMTWQGPPAGSRQGARALDRNNICMNAGFGGDGDTTAHELGHVLQMRLFGQDVLRDKYSDPTGIHFLDQPCGSDSCATTEGWADYVAARSWWSPEVPTAQPYMRNIPLEPPPGSSSLDHHLAATCSGNARIEGQVARAFWDLDDAQNEGAVAPALYADAVDLDTLAIADVWDNFPDGTANGQDYESDDQGVNMHDYYNNGPLDFNRAITTTSHNCLDSQDTN